jgi:hypothetical protein
MKPTRHDFIKRVKECLLYCQRENGTDPGGLVFIKDDDIIPLKQKLSNDGFIENAMFQDRRTGKVYGCGYSWNLQYALWAEKSP